MKLYTIKCCGSFEKFCATKEIAERELSKITSEIKTRRPDILEDKSDSFQFLLGWEEKLVHWKIIEIDVMDS